MTPVLITALAVGFLGSTHCIGMCGGIVGALNAGLPPFHARSKLLRLTYNLLYNAGRILSYAVAGGIAGYVGAQSSAMALDVIVPVGEIIAGVFLVALGLYIGGWGHALVWLERGGQYVWRYIQPLGQPFLPVRSPPHAFGLGLVWGWLPCGLVYSALTLALLSSSAVEGATVMLVFGLGTLPAMLAAGQAAEYLKALMQRTTLRRGAGMAVMLFGVYTATSALTGGGHHHGHVSTSPTPPQHQTSPE
jgi:uncharacterized protein